MALRMLYEMAGANLQGLTIRTVPVVWSQILESVNVDHKKMYSSHAGSRLRIDRCRCRCWCKKVSHLHVHA